MTVVELCLLVRHFLRERRTWLIQATQRRDQRQGRTNGKRARTGGYITLICRAVWLILQSEPYPCSGRGSSSLVHGGRAQSAPGILDRLSRRVGGSDSSTSTLTLKLFLLARLSRQLPLLSSLMIVRLCHGGLSH